MHNALNNILIGGSGNNVIIGSTGADVLTGGLGADTFDFNLITESLVGAGRDIITDFSALQLDKVDLSGIDAISSTSAVNDVFSYIGTGAFTNVAGQVRFNAGIVYGDVNGDSVSDFEIQLTGVTVLAVSDFIL